MNMSKALPQGKTKRSTEEASKQAGRPALSEAERKITVGVGLKQAEIFRLDQARMEQVATIGMNIEQSVYLRSCLLAHLALLDLTKEGMISGGVITKIRERMTKEAQAQTTVTI